MGAMEAMEAELVLKSASVLVVGLWSTSVTGRRVGNRGETWERSGATASARGSMASPAAEAMKRRTAPMAARSEKGRKDETRPEERHVGQGYD